MLDELKRTNADNQRRVQRVRWSTNFSQRSQKIWNSPKARSSVNGWNLR